jgi:hypothetical protein
MRYVAVTFRVAMSIAAIASAGSRGLRMIVAHRDIHMLSIRARLNSARASGQRNRCYHRVRAGVDDIDVMRAFVADEQKSR